ncbi:MAG: hypothetical protein J0H82_06115 [Alphaproteobacteria bacterium]|jgi:hypothetical protein|nr:hypothetical protein [Alphaproteobacteria bacterium]
MTSATRRQLMTTSALSGPIAAAAYVVAAGGTRPGIARGGAMGKSHHFVTRLIHSAAEAADEMPALPASPAGVRPAVSSHDLAGATTSAVAPVLSGGTAAPAATIREN